MLCQICKSAPASVHIQEFVNGKERALHLCPECAQKRMLNTNQFDKPHMMEFFQKLTNSIMGNDHKHIPMVGMIDIKGAHAADKAEEHELRCSACGYTIQQFRKQHRLQCGKCYDSFSNELEREFVLSNRSDIHVGRVPLTPNESFCSTGLSKRLQQENQLAELKKQLKEMLVREEYDLAAKIKCQMLELEQSMNSLPFQDEISADDREK